jgi:hypothetical protein
LPDVSFGIHSPARLVAAYRSLLHVPRPVLALLALLSLLAVVARKPARRETFLFSGSGIALLLGSAATAGFSFRYLLPAVPLLAVGGTLAGGGTLPGLIRRLGRDAPPI